MKLSVQMRNRQRSIGRTRSRGQQRTRSRGQQRSRGRGRGRGRSRSIRGGHLGSCDDWSYYNGRECIPTNCKKENNEMWSGIETGCIPCSSGKQTQGKWCK